MDVARPDAMQAFGRRLAPMQMHSLPMFANERACRSGVPGFHVWKKRGPGRKESRGCDMPPGACPVWSGARQAMLSVIMPQTKHASSLARAMTALLYGNVLMSLKNLRRSLLFARSA